MVSGGGGGDVGEGRADEGDVAGGEAAGYQVGEVEGGVDADGGEGCAGAVAGGEFGGGEGAELEGGEGNDRWDFAIDLKRREGEKGEFYIWDNVSEPVVCREDACAAGVFVLGSLFEVDGASVAFYFWRYVSRVCSD